MVVFEGQYDEGKALVFLFKDEIVLDGNFYLLKISLS